MLHSGLSEGDLCLTSEEIGSIPSSVQVVLVLCQPSIEILSEFSKDTLLSPNIPLPEIFHNKEQWAWCLDYICFHPSFSRLLHYL